MYVTKTKTLNLSIRFNYEKGILLIKTSKITSITS